MDREDIFEMDMTGITPVPTKPNPNAKRPEPLKRGTRKKRDKELSDKKKMVSLSRDIFRDLEKKTPRRVKSPIELDQDKVFKSIERHNKSLKKSPVAVSGRKTLATIPPRTKLIISPGQDQPTDAQAFAYDNDPTSRMAPYQYHNFMLAKKKEMMRRKKLLQHQQQMRAKAGDSIDDFAKMSLERREYQKMKMRERQERTNKSGGKRRKKKTRKKRGGWKLIELNVNDLNQEAIGGDFSFTKKGYPHVFDGRLTAYNTDVASFRLTDPPGTLNVNINTIDKIWKYEAEFDTDKNMLEFISGRRRGGRRKKTRKRKGKGKGKGEKYGNLKFREIRTRTPLESTNIERVYEIDVDAIIKDERKSQQLLNKYNKTVQEWKKIPFYKRKKKSELSDLANQLEFQLRNRQDREMDDSLIQTTNPEKQHYAKLGKDKDGNIIIPKGLIVSSNTKPKSKTRKKGMQVLRMRAAAQAPRKIGIGGRRTRKKRKKLMCPKNCCGVPVDKCGCPVSCPHCNCPEIKRLRKLLKKTRKKCVKKKKRKKKTRRRKK